MINVEAHAAHCWMASILKKKTTTSEAEQLAAYNTKGSRTNEVEQIATYNTKRSRTSTSRKRIKMSRFLCRVRKSVSYEQTKR